MSKSFLKKLAGLSLIFLRFWLVGKACRLHASRAPRCGSFGWQYLAEAPLWDGSAMSDRAVRDELLTLLVAGHETTAQGLSWAMYLTHRNPETRLRLLAELAGLPTSAEPDTIAALPYLEAVCNETLRLNPISSEAMRHLHKPLTLGGYTLPAGVSVATSIIGIHRRPDLYPEPESFRPERFLQRNYTQYEFMPFGGGMRRCLGAAFAQYEMKQVLFALLTRFSLRLASERPVKAALRGITLGPKGDLALQIEAVRSR